MITAAVINNNFRLAINSKILQTERRPRCDREPFLLELNFQSFRFLSVPWEAGSAWFCAPESWRLRPRGPIWNRPWPRSRTGACCGRRRTSVPRWCWRPGPNCPRICCQRPAWARFGWWGHACHIRWSKTAAIQTRLCWKNHKLKINTRQRHVKL